MITVKQILKWWRKKRKVKKLEERDGAMLFDSAEQMNEWLVRNNYGGNKMNLEIGQLYIADGWDRALKFIGHVITEDELYIGFIEGETRHSFPKDELIQNNLRKYEEPKFKFENGERVRYIHRGPSGNEYWNLLGTVKEQKADSFIYYLVDFDKDQVKPSYVNFNNPTACNETTLEKIEEPMVKFKLELNEWYIADGWIKPRKFTGYYFNCACFDGYPVTKFDAKNIRKHIPPKFKLDDEVVLTDNSDPRIYFISEVCPSYESKSQFYKISREKNKKETYGIIEECKLKLYEEEKAEEPKPKFLYKEVASFNQKEAVIIRSYYDKGWKYDLRVDSDEKVYWGIEENKIKKEPKPKLQKGDRVTFKNGQTGIVENVAVVNGSAACEVRLCHQPNLVLCLEYDLEKLPAEEGHGPFCEVLESGKKYWDCNRKKVFVATHDADVAPQNKYMELSEFEPEVGKKYNFKKNSWMGDSEYLEYRGIGNHPFNKYLFYVPEHGMHQLTRNELEEYLIGEYREEKSKIEVKLPGGIKPEEADQVRLYFGGACGGGKSNAMKIVAESHQRLIKQKEEKMREFVENKHYVLPDFLHNPFRYIGQGGRSDGLQYHIFESSEEDKVKILKGADILNKITEHRELEKLSFVQYARKFDKDKIADIAHNRNSYSDIPELLGENAKTPFGNHKIFKLDITATEVSEEEINKIKQEQK